MTESFDSAISFSPVSQPAAVLGESPVWCPVEAAVWWIDIEGRRLFKTESATGRTHQWTTPEMPGCLVLNASLDPIVGMESGLFSFNASRARFERILQLGDEGTRFNDATVDSAGCLWAGTTDIRNEKPLGKLYRIEPDLSVTVIRQGIYTLNGLAVDPERGWLYLSDSFPTEQWIERAPLDPLTGELGSWVSFAGTQHLAGRPDGAAIDEAGYYWIAGVGGGEIYRFDPDGRLAATVPVPVDAPTKLAFGGGDGSDLYLTSKSDGLNGGRLHVAALSIRGRTPARFGEAGKRVGRAERAQRGNRRHS